MPIVEIPIVGNVEFPDSMSQDDIIKAIETDIIPSASPSGASRIQAPGTRQPKLASGFAQPIPQVFPVAEQKVSEIQSAPEMSAEEAGRIASTPFISLPRAGAPGTAARAASDVAAGLVEQTLLTPQSGLLGATMLIPGLRAAVGAALAAGAAKSAAQDLGEAAVTGNRETATRGILTGALALAGGIGAGADIATTRLSDLAPQTAQALRESGIEQTKAKPNEIKNEVQNVQEIGPNEVQRQENANVQEEVLKKPALVAPEQAPEVPAPTETAVTAADSAGGDTPAASQAIAETIPETPISPPEPAAESEVKPSAASEIGQGTTYNPVQREATLTDPIVQPDPSEGPGAASPSDFPKDSQLSQLTEAIKGTEPVRAPLGKRLANEAAVIKKQLQEGWEGALDNLRLSGQRAIANLRGIHPWTDFKEATGEFSGAINRNDRDLYLFTNEIRKSVPDKLRREAIVNWIQADGDSTVLRAREAASADPHKAGYSAALDLTPDELTLAGNIRSYLDSKLDEGMKAGLLKSGVENYVSQVWKEQNPITEKLLGLATTGKLQPNFKFARQRIFESYFEGEQAGYVPRIKDIGALVAAYDQSFSRAIAARNWLKAMHEGKASDGRPLVEVSGVSVLAPDGGDPGALLIKPKVKPSDIGTYKPIDHPAMHGWKWAGTAENGEPVLYQGDLLVHPEVFRHVRNVLTPSMLQDFAPTKALLQVQSLLKQSKLAISGFHFTQEAMHALAHRVNPFSPVKIDFTVPEQNALVNHGLQIADYRAYQAFAEGLSGAGSVYERVPVVGKWLSRYNELLFQEYIPRLKMSMAMEALERNRNAYRGKLNDSQILELTANQSNAAFGELNYTMLGRNKTIQDFIRLAALAPDFLEARGRFAAQAVTGTGREQRIALALQAATLYTATRLMNQMYSGDAHWNPRDAFEVYINKKAYGLRTMAGDLMHLANDPGNFTGNRLAPLAKAIVEFATHRDMHGIKRTALEQVKDLADWLRPISAERPVDKTRLDQSLAAAGATVRPASATQRIYRLLNSFKQDQSLVTKEEKEGMVGASDYSPLRTALFHGDEKAALQEYQKLLAPSDGTKARTPKQVRDHFIHYPRTPFSGSKKIEQQFFSSLSDRDKQLYLEATREKREIALKFIQLQQSKKP